MTTTKKGITEEEYERQRKEAVKNLGLPDDAMILLDEGPTDTHEPVPDSEEDKLVNAFSAGYDAGFAKGYKKGHDRAIVGKGGAGSGNFGHSGRPGEGPGGSGPSEGGGGGGDHGMWIRGASGDVEHEYKIEYTNHTPPGNPFPTLDSFKEAVKNGTPLSVTPAIDKSIAYRSHTTSFSGLKSLVSGYASWPKFRNEGTLRALQARIEAGHPTNMPLVIKYPDGRMRVLSGNTRMDLAFQAGKNPTVLVLDAPGKKK